jgi:hypothetical protein
MEVIAKLSCFLAIFVAVYATPVREVPTGYGIFGVDKFQGDIMLNDRQKELIFGDPEHIDPNSGLLNTARRWPMNLQGQIVVPYRIQASEGYSKKKVH